MPIRDYSKVFVRYDLVTESPYYSIKRSAGENQTMAKVIECVLLGDLDNIANDVKSAL